MSIVERAILKLQQAHRESVRESVVPATLAPVQLPASPTAGHEQNFSSRLQRRTEHRHSMSLDVAALRRSRLLPPPEQERELAAQYRHIKRPLISRGVGRGQERTERGNSVMFTSALPGEGKSFTTMNMALSMALEQELRVLLVDADVARPRLSRDLGIEKESGLIDALREDTLDIEQLVIDTDIPTLTLLSAGSYSDTATELLAGPRMGEIVRHLCDSDPNRMVLFDSPPLLPTTEARVLAQAVGQVVLVVRAARTLQQAVQEALFLIGERDDVSLVLTHSERVGAGSYYYYGNYGYGDYGPGREQ